LNRISSFILMMIKRVGIFKRITAHEHSRMPRFRYIFIYLLYFFIRTSFISFVVFFIVVSYIINEPCAFARVPVTISSVQINRDDLEDPS